MSTWSSIRGPDARARVLDAPPPGYDVEGGEHWIDVAVSPSGFPGRIRLAIFPAGGAQGTYLIDEALTLGPEDAANLIRLLTEAITAVEHQEVRR